MGRALPEVERRLTEEYALRRAIEKALPAGLATTDMEGRQCYVSAAFCGMVGWSEEELLGGRPPYVYWPEEERGAIQRAFQATLLGQAPPEGFELRFQRRNGERFDVLVRVAPVADDGGNLSGWLASVWDITERKGVEQRRNAEHEVTRILASAPSVANAAPRILRAIGEALEWKVGAMW
jgi:PAS domain S-box-containing protein